VQDRSKNVHRILVGESEGNRLLERCTQRLENNIKMFLQGITFGNVERPDCVGSRYGTAMSPKLNKILRNFVTGIAIIRLPKRTPLHGATLKHRHC
jgi:hypothetical protein